MHQTKGLLNFSS